MKTIYLIRGQYDGGKSNDIAADLNKAGLAFVSRTYGLDQLPFSVSAVPCVAIEENGEFTFIEDRPEKPFAFKDLDDALKALPKPVRLAKITLDQAAYAVNEPITVQIDVVDAQGIGQTDFAGMFIVDIQGPQGAMPVRFDFLEGTAARTLALSVPGYYRVNESVTPLVKVPPTSIQVYV